MTTRHPITHRYAMFLLAACALGGEALADDDGHDKRAPLLPKYQQECSACHVAYPPRLLPPASWQHLMQNLPRHFGTDASLDAASINELSTWLEANAASRGRLRERPAEDRITRSAWFVREHDEVSASTWKLPSVKSASNCAACHTQADQGDFSERTLRVPR